MSDQASCICIVGMHRSGTSMVANLLRQCGLYLGNESDLLPASNGNSDGHWEHLGFMDLNDQLLARLSGGWDKPPEASVLAALGSDARMDDLRKRGRALAATFAGRQWGWKDPRTSITVTFWKGVLPQSKFVVCLRNPLEVASSLRQRGMCSYTAALALWRAYNQQLLAHSSRGERIVTHYSNYWIKPEQEVRRLLDFAGLKATAESLRFAAAVTKESLRHHEFTAADLLELNVAPDIIEMYRQLCDEAQYTEQPRRTQVIVTPGPEVDEEAVLTLGLRRQVQSLAEELRKSREQIRQLQVAEANARAEQRKQQEESRKQQQEEARKEQEEKKKQQHEASRRQQQEEVRKQQQEIIALRQAFEVLKQQSAKQHQELLEAISKLQKKPTAEVAGGGEYANMVRRIRKYVETELPPDANVLVASKGDEQLVKLEKQRGQHFPQDERGQYPGYYPASGMTAIVQLEALRSKGATHFILPATMAWWLEHYGDFTKHLRSRYREITSDPKTCFVFSLLERPTQTVSAAASQMQQIVELFHARCDRDPSILDWGSKLQAGSIPSEQAVVMQAAEGKSLGYVDGSIDIVVLGGNDPQRMQEASRVATTAVVRHDPAKASLDVTWKTDAGAASLPSVSIIIPVHNGMHLTSECLVGLQLTLPQHLDVEIIVVDDASTDETPAKLGAFAAQDKRIRVIRNDKNAGFLHSTNRGAAAAKGDVLVFLNNDVILLPNWLPPLLRTLRDMSQAGAVGGEAAESRWAVAGSRRCHLPRWFGGAVRRERSRCVSGAVQLRARS